MVVISLLVIGAYALMADKADVPKKTSDLTDLLPNTSLSLANREDVVVNINWKGPERDKKLGKDVWIYDVEIRNLKLEYEGDKLPKYALHPILTIKDQQVNDLNKGAVSFRLTDAILKDDNVFDYPDIKVTGIKTTLKPRTEDFDNKIVYNKEFVELSFWQETTCFTSMYKTVPQAPFMIESCCKSLDDCDLIGSVLLENNYYVYAPGLIKAELVPKVNIAAFTAGETRQIFFEIQNIGSLYWDPYDDVEADNHMVLAVYGCVDDADSTKRKLIRIPVFSSISKTIYHGEKITNEDLPVINCLLPQNRDDIRMVLFGNCLSTGGHMKTEGFPCSNTAGVIVLGEVQPYLR